MAHGVDGVFELAEPAPANMPPMRASMLACRMRIRGVRVRSDGAYKWRLATHTDLAGWFIQPLFELPPVNLRGQPRPTPEILRRARQQLDAFLYRPGRLTERGFADINRSQR